MKQRKLIVSMNMTLDGFMSGPHNDLDWHFRSWNNEMAQTAAEQLSKADTILLGRITYQAMAGYWPAKAMDLHCDREGIVFAEMMNNHKKVVFSKTLRGSVWHNTRLVNKNFRNEIISLKNQQGKDLIVYGSGKIAANLMKLGLVDEYHLWIHPVLLGSGNSFFYGVANEVNLKVTKIKRFRSGVILLYLQVKQSPMVQRM